MRFRELVNVHLEMRGEAFGIPVFKIDKPGLAAAHAAALALEIWHKGKKRFRTYSPHATKPHGPFPCDLVTCGLVADYFPSCCSTKSPITGNL